MAEIFRWREEFFASEEDCMWNGEKDYERRESAEGTQDALDAPPFRSEHPAVPIVLGASSGSERHDEHRALGDLGRAENSRNEDISWNTARTGGETHRRCQNK